MGYTREQLESMEHPAIQQIAKKLGISPAGQTRTALIREIAKLGANGASTNGAARPSAAAKPASAPTPAPTPAPPINPEAAKKPPPKAAAPAATTHPTPDHRAEVRALIAGFDARAAAWKAEVEEVCATTQRLLAQMGGVEAVDAKATKVRAAQKIVAAQAQASVDDMADAELAAEAAADGGVMEDEFEDPVAATAEVDNEEAPVPEPEPEAEGDGELTPEMVATMPLRLLRQACRDFSLPFNSAKDGEEVLRAKLTAALEEAGAVVAEEPPPEDTFEDDAPPPDPTPPPAPKRKPAVATAPKPAGPMAGVAPVPPARLAVGMKCRLYWPEDPDLGDRVYDVARVTAFDLDAGTAEVVFTGDADEDGNTEFLSSGTPLAKVFPPAPVARRKT